MVCRGVTFTTGMVVAKSWLTGGVHNIRGTVVSLFFLSSRRQQQRFFFSDNGRKERARNKKKAWEEDHPCLLDGRTMRQGWVFFFA